MISILFSLNLLMAGLLGSENAQLIILIQQSQQQLAELKRISQMNLENADALKKAMALSEQLSRGIDSVLEPYASSREYQRAAMKLQQELRSVDQEKESYKFLKDHFPSDAKELQNRRDRGFQFQNQIDQANRSDLSDVMLFEQKLIQAEPGEVQRLGAMAGSKSWESNLRLSTQLNEILSELRMLRDDLSRKEWEQKIQEEEVKRQWKKALGARGGSQ